MAGRTIQISSAASAAVLTMFLLSSTQAWAGGLPSELNSSPSGDSVSVDSDGETLIARKKKKKKRRKKKKDRSEDPPETEDSASDEGSGDEEPADVEMEEDGGTAGDEPSGPTLQRGNRMEFDGRLIRGETAGAGAVFLFERAPRPLPSMVKRRRSYLGDTVEGVLGTEWNEWEGEGGNADPADSDDKKKKKKKSKKKKKKRRRK